MDNILYLNFEIENAEKDRKMPYSFGLHPAFNFPIDKNEKREDYKLELEKEENVFIYDYDLNDFKEIKLKEIPLVKERLEETIILKGFTSSYVRLYSDKNYVEVECDNYPYLGFWSYKDAPLICLEPWQGISDLKENDYDFYHRPGTKLLSPKGIARYQSYIKIG